MLVFRPFRNSTFLDPHVWLMTWNLLDTLCKRWSMCINSNWGDFCIIENILIFETHLRGWRLCLKKFNTKSLCMDLNGFQNVENPKSPKWNLLIKWALQANKFNFSTKKIPKKIKNYRMINLKFVIYQRYAGM